MESEEQGTVLVREAGPDDLRAILELWRELAEYHDCLGPSYELSTEAPSAYESWVTMRLASDQVLFLLAETGGRAVGYIQAGLYTRPAVLVDRACAAIDECLVTCEFRRRGIGERLVQEICRMASERGVTRVEVGYATSNDVSTLFWQKMGFEPYCMKAWKKPG